MFRSGMRLVTLGALGLALCAGPVQADGGSSNGGQDPPGGPTPPGTTKGATEQSTDLLLDAWSLLVSWFVVR